MAIEKVSVFDEAETTEIYKKYRDAREKQISDAKKALTDKQRDFLEKGRGYHDLEMSEMHIKLKEGLESGKYKKPSDFFKKECKWLFGDIIFDCFKDSFLFSVDNVIKYPYTKGWLRRPFRSGDYTNYIFKINLIVDCYKRINLPKTLPQRLRNEFTDEERAYLSRCSSFSEEYEIAYQIEKGDETVLKWISEVLDSGSTESTSYAVFRAVFMSSNTELHKKTADLLLAARLQEGLRQAICETCDEGTIEAFRTILGCIKDADLIRFSSVKRAVATWTGIMTPDSSDLDRIGRKEFELIYGCLSDEKFRAECIASDDAMKCYTGIWSLAVTETADAVKKIEELSEKGTHQQLLTAALFSSELSNSFANRISTRLLAEHCDEHDIMAIVMPKYLSTSGKRWDEFTGENADATLLELFDNRQQAENAYDRLKELRSSISGKEEVFSPIVFPWMSAKLTKSDVVQHLMLIAGLLNDNDKIDEMSQLFSEIAVEGYGSSRWWYIEILLSEPKNDTQMDALVACCADRESYTSERAFKLVKTHIDKLTPEHYKFFEGMLRYKKAEIRSSVIAMLMNMDDDALYDTIDRLIGDKKEEKRTGGLDIIMQLSKDEKRAELFGKSAELVDKIAAPTSKEKILIDSIKESTSNSEPKDTTYGLYTEEDSYVPEWEEDYIADCRKAFAEYFPASDICKKPKKTKPDFIETFKKLADLIHEHRNDEYEDYGGETAVLGNANRIYTYDSGKKKINFEELWDEFYEKEIKSIRLLVRMDIYRQIKGRFSKIVGKLFGEEFLEKVNLPYIQLMDSIVEELCDKYCTNEATDNILTKIRYSVYSYLCEYPDVEAFFNIEPTNWKSSGYFVSEGKVREVEGSLELITNNYYLFGYKGYKGCDLKTQFATEVKLAEKTGIYVVLDEKREDRKENRYGRRIEYHEFPSTTAYLKAAYDGIITKGYMYKHFFTECLDLKGTMNTLSDITGGYRELGKTVTNRIRWGRNSAVTALGSLIGSNERAKENKLTDEDRKIAEFAIDIYETLADIILDTELKRGDSPTEFSNSVVGFKRIYGVKRFVQILAALGKETLDRSSYYYGNNISRKQSFSHLLGICMPDEDDNADKLRELLKDTDITEKRLVEAALFAPQWLDIIQEYLGWDGFRSACYYFMAHMNESLDEMRTAVIAKYTPISTSDLMGGAFDINWFREAYNTVGQERFDIIYDSAKYITDGTKHSRARKYADAVMGRLDKAEAEKNIIDKRNKDTLMAYGLIPFENDDDIVERYLLFSKFLKESKQFGAQRRASESNAVERAMQNLALNAGYDDTMRLTLRMETRLFDSIRELTEFNEVEDVKIRLVIDDAGKTTVECMKGEKPLKSVPAKLKKNETVVRIGEVKKQLTEQYRRTRQMFEQSMEDRTKFTALEIDALSKNPVIQPLIRDLVWVCGKDMGFVKKMKLVSCDGSEKKLKKDSELVIAHPYDMYNAGVWRDYQKYLFDNQIVQTFKQVFRELYVKTEEEMDMLYSRRYSGNQIQPKQTLGCLKGRRWVADVEDGLQKIFYKENIIAEIYAMADWFSPSDIEAPTLEWVQFSDRKTGEPIKIKDIPDVIFSEVMRDVDLAVSVAHAGQVDPETSHSTIEMRRAICEFTLPLFRLDNVTFNKNHALINGKRADYTVHLGSGVVHIQGGPMINVLPVHSQHRGKIFLPFADEDPKTAQILTEILFFAEDEKLKDPFILEQIK